MRKKHMCSCLGNSTHILTLAIFCISFILAGIYYATKYTEIKNENINILNQITPTSKPIVIIEKSTESLNIPTKIQDYSESCGALPQNPLLLERYESSSGDDCGFINNLTSKSEIDILEIKDCLNDSIEECKEAKAYIKVEYQGSEVEYLFIADNCSVNVERWSADAPYCGIMNESCKKLSDTFPFKTCEEPKKIIILVNDIPQTIKSLCNSDAVKEYKDKSTGKILYGISEGTDFNGKTTFYFEDGTDAGEAQWSDEERYTLKNGLKSFCTYEDRECPLFIRDVCK